MSTLLMPMFAKMSFLTSTFRKIMRDLIVITVHTWQRRHNNLTIMVLLCSEESCSPKKLLRLKHKERYTLFNAQYCDGAAKTRILFYFIYHQSARIFIINKSQFLITNYLSFSDFLCHLFFSIHMPVENYQNTNSLLCYLTTA